MKENAGTDMDGHGRARTGMDGHGRAWTWAAATAQVVKGLPLFEAARGRAGK